MVGLSLSSLNKGSRDIGVKSAERIKDGRSKQMSTPSSSGGKPKRHLALKVRRGLHALLKPKGFILGRGASCRIDGDIVKLIYVFIGTKPGGEAEIVQLGFFVSSDRIAQVVSGLDKVSPGSGVLSTFDRSSRDERDGPFGLLTEQDVLDAIELFYDLVEEVVFPIFDSIHSEQDLFRFALAHPEYVEGDKRAVNRWIATSGVEL